MKFPDAKHSLKMACGENPKRVYGNRGQAPSTRMGNFAGYRKAWIEAENYLNRIEAYESKSDEEKTIESPPKRDLRLDTLSDVLKDEILVHIHCYRAEEMALNSHSKRKTPTAVSFAGKVRLFGDEAVEGIIKP